MASSIIPQTSGIYKITCTANGKIYIGSSADMYKRWRRHLNDLRNHTHHNRYLQRAFAKFGELSFGIEILEFAAPHVLLEREQYWLDALQPFNEKGFNLNLTADGSHLSQESIEKIRLAKTGKNLSPEHRAKIAAANMGRPGNKGNTGRIFTETHRHKISARLTGKRKSAEHCANNAKSQSKYRYIVTSPSGEVIEVGNMRQFCRENHLHQGHMAAVARGEKSSYCGWKCRYA
jgi:group I intron endonuclease